MTTYSMSIYPPPHIESSKPREMLKHKRRYIYIGIGSDSKFEIGGAGDMNPSILFKDNSEGLWVQTTG